MSEAGRKRGVQVGKKKQVDHLIRKIEGKAQMKEVEPEKPN